MTPEPLQALELLAQAAKLARLTWDEHIAVAKAYELLLKVLTPPLPKEQKSNA